MSEVQPWPDLPAIPDGMRLRKRRDDALTAAVVAEDRVEAAEKSVEDAIREDKRHDLQAASLPLEQWNARARELEAARAAAERFLGVVSAKRNEAVQDFESAHVAYEQQGLHTDCRRYNERILDVARWAEGFETALLDLVAAAPGNDSSIRRQLNDQLVRLLSSIVSRTTGAAFSSVRSTDARAFAVEMLVTPSDTMFRRVSYITENALQDHWVKCRSSNPARYRAERKRRKIGGKGGVAAEEEPA